MIVWRDVMSVGAPSLDADHKGLIETINEAEHWIHMESWTQLELISTELLRYVDEHFRREEAILDAVSYRDIAHHKAQHAAMVLRAKAFHEKFLVASTDEEKRSCSLALVKTLGEWLINHILKEDMKYRNFIPRKAPARSNRPR